MGRETCQFVEYTLVESALGFATSLEVLPSVLANGSEVGVRIAHLIVLFQTLPMGVKLGQTVFSHFCDPTH